MKRPRTLQSYFTPAPQRVAQDQETTQVPPSAPSSAPDRETTQNQDASVAQDQGTAVTAQAQVQDAPSLGTEQATVGTEASVARAQDGATEQDSNHVLAPEDIIADPGLRKPIEEMHPNIRDDAKREYVLLGPCQPKGHNYPVRKIYGKNRRFIDKWFTNRAWLEYSVSKDAAFCFYCYLFKPFTVENYGSESFSKNGFTNWKDGPQLFDDHANSIAHNKARKDYESYKNQRQSVTHVMARGSKKEEQEYKGRLIIILGVVRFLLLQAHAFRGHDESSTSRNKGNFLEMLDWYKKRDESAAQLLNTAAKNHAMTSHTIQKDLCKACGDLTVKAIVDDIGDKRFAILVDEARDASIKEQMAVIVRYVNSRGQVIERFIGVKSVADTTSAALKEALDGMFALHGLSMSRLRGQGYDGASNMRGEFHGLQRRILDENPHAFYIHCFAHQLQLVVVSVAKCCSSVFDFFNITALIVNTVNGSCKRRDQLAQQHHDHIVNQLEGGTLFSGRGKNQETNLARAGDTRWGSHNKTLCRLDTMWLSVLEVLENIAEDGNGDKKTTASGLLKQMENFEFVLILHLMIKLLGTTNDLSQCLQRKDQNIVRAVSLIGLTLQKINDTRENGWEDLLEEVKKFCVGNNIIVPNMEDTVTIRGRARGRGGQEVTYYHHFKNEIFNVVHDKVIVEFNNRFAERSTQLLRCIACLDPNNSFANYDREKLVQLAEIYDLDFSEYECRKLRTQLDYFIDDVRADPSFSNCSDLGVLAMKMVETDRHTTFPLVYRLIELALILPVATATVERAFSAMKIIKTDLSNKMGDEWLNHRMVCYIERDVFASIPDDDILQHFQELKSRLKKLPSTVCYNDLDDAMEEANAPSH